MTSGSKIQAMLGKPVERVWAVYTDGTLVHGYIRSKAEALALAKTERARIGETRASLAADKPSRVRVFPM